MTEEQNKFLAGLIADSNYLGAAQYLKNLSLDSPERSAIMGKVISAVVDDLSLARGKGNRERTVYLRSVLSWLLRDYPGLASMYREQLRIASGNTDVLPELARGVRNLGDVFSGKKTVQEGMDDASEPLETIAEQAGELFKDGLNQIGEFFVGFGRKNSRDPETNGYGDSAANAGDHSSATDNTNDDNSSDETIEVKIENADDPLPHEIHDADTHKH